MIAYALVQQFGCRIVIMFGAAIAALMNLAVAFVSESYLIVITYGAIGGNLSQNHRVNQIVPSFYSSL